jgi:antitoxin CptB
MAEADRLRWRCRRGLLELELILTSFLDRHFERLDAGEREILGELLDCPDNDLLDWALGRSNPPAGRFGPLVELLRTTPVERAS